MIETEGLTGAETLLRVLSHMGVDRIFSSPGSEWSPVWEAFAKAKAQSEGVPQYISSRHEEVAVGMASGYAKSTGKLAAVMIHTTVGALHATMALRGALHEQIPMVVFTGESLGFGEEAGPDVGAQWLGALADIGGPARLVDRCVKWSYGVNAKSLLPSTIQRACQLAMGTPKGPVFVSLPMEYLFDKMTKNAAAENVPIPAPTADAAAIEELAALLAGAKNPIIITEEAGRDPRVVLREFSAPTSLARRLRAAGIFAGSGRDSSARRDRAMAPGIEETKLGNSSRRTVGQSAPLGASLLGLPGQSNP